MLSHQNSSRRKLLLCIPTRPRISSMSWIIERKKSLSGIKIQGIDGALDSLQLSAVCGPVHMSIRVVKPACCFQVSSPVIPQVLGYWGRSMKNSLTRPLQAYSSLKSICVKIPHWKYKCKYWSRLNGCVCYLWVQYWNRYVKRVNLLVSL